jgi:hypothetical protein
MAIKVTDFAANLKGGGARPNIFEVFCGSQPKIGGTQELSKITYLCKAASLPMSEVTKIAVPYRGRNIYVAGVRQFEETWNTTVINDTDFKVRRAMEAWQNAIHSHEGNIGETDITLYSTDITVTQLHHLDGKGLRTYKFKHAWPSQVAAIELAADSNDAIEEFEIQWAYSWWMVETPQNPSVRDGEAAEITTT